MTPAERVQASIRAVNSAGRNAVPAGAFVLYRHPTSDHRYLNYAVPAQGASEWSGIDELRDAFAARGLVPRLEFVAECAPGLEEALAAAGFSHEARIPVMTCALADLREVPAPDGVVIARVHTGADVRPLLEVAHEAFGEPPRRRAARSPTASARSRGSACSSASAGAGSRRPSRLRQRPTRSPRGPSCASSRLVTRAPSASTRAPGSRARARPWST
jgi:hypothetical protein